MMQQMKLLEKVRARITCKNCGSYNIARQGRGSSTEIFKCNICRKRSFFFDSELKALSEQIDTEKKLAKAPKTIDALMAKSQSYALPEASEMFAEKKRLNPDKDLYEFQSDDLDYFLKLFESDEGPDGIKAEPRVILNFNRMGLGKSPEAISTVLKTNAARVLVLCNKNIITNWKSLIWQWAGENSAITLDSTYYKFEDWKAKYLHRWFIANVEILRNKSWAKILIDWPFDFVIYDEAHSMRNVEDAAKAREAFAFLKQYLEASKKFDGKLMLMSGSPIVNDAGDIYPHLALAYPTYITSRAGFIRQHLLTEFGYKKEKIVGFKNPDFITKLINARGVQHTKEDKLPGLPPKTYNIIPLEMDEQQNKLYREVEAGIEVALENGEVLHAPYILEQFIRLRQICVDPALVGADDVPSVKMDFLQESFLDELNGEPFVVFSTFETGLSNKLTKMFEARGLRVGLITGQVDGNTRFQNVEKFQRGDLDVIFATIQAGAEGITLTRASHVLMIDRWWTPASNEQAVDRLHRISQERPVTVHWLQIQNAFDEYLDTVLEEKRTVAESIRIGGRGIVDDGDSIKEIQGAVARKIMQARRKYR